jgi:hypothetical protein
LGSEWRRVAKSLRVFLSELDSLSVWLSQERGYIEDHNGYFSHWGAPGEHIGFVITRGEFSGQMHASSDGSISMYVERGYEDEILLNTSTAVSDENGFKIFFKQFRDAIIDAAS